MADDRWPKGTHVRCIDPEHRSHQHSQGVGTIMGTGTVATFALGSGHNFAYEVAWAQVTRIYAHDAATLMRVYSKQEQAAIRAEARAQLDKLKQEI